MTASPTDIAVTLDDITHFGSGLSRPECVLCTAAGDLYIAHRGVGVMHVRPDGGQTPIGDPAGFADAEWVPNGIALRDDGGFLVANMGDTGGVWRLDRNGAIAPFLMEVDGEPLTRANFVFDDDEGRIWITVTTRSTPMTLAMTALGAPDRADGFICVVDDSGARIVADGIAFANEARFDRSGEWLYVAETFGRRISRFRVGAGAALSDRETFASFGHGTFADGIAFDAEDCLWVASVISNRLIRIAPDVSQTVVPDDSVAAHVDAVEAALADGTTRREMFYEPHGRVLRNIASVSFGGRDLRTVYLGSLAGDSLAVFRSPVPGLKLPHWER